MTMLAALTLGLARVQAEIPQMIHYQGYVTANDLPFNGTGTFKFALVNQSGTTTYWSHDGTSVGGAAPATIVNIEVHNGLYDVFLGDTSVSGMTQVVPSSAFADHRDVFLRVWFDDGVSGLELLEPDTRIASVGFAMVAATVSAGAINSSALAPSLTLGGISGGSSNVGTLTLKSRGDQTRAVLDAGTQNGNASLKLYDATGVFDTVRLVGAESGSAGGQLLLRNGSGNTTLEFDGQDGGDITAGGVVRFKKNDGKDVLTLEADLDSGNSGLLLFDATGTQETVRLTGANNGTRGGFFSLKNTNSNPTIQLLAQETDDPTSASLLQMKQNNGRQTVTLRSGLIPGALGGGSLALGNSTGNNTVELAGDGGENQGRLILKHSDLANRVRIDADGVNDGGELKLYDADGTETINLRAAQGQSAGASIQLSKADGTATITLDAEANGEGVITTQVLTITGGSDLSERFEVGSEAGHAEPGMIVSIDPDRRGELRISDRPYDSAVAGVISGAGGVKPGLLMGQHGTLADGQHPVALSGRVYCYVDASHGAVKPGDLITTSATPGHGMKADPAKASGASIGKAMTPLKEGKGLVLVLVSLR